MSRLSQARARRLRRRKIRKIIKIGVLTIVICALLGLFSLLTVKLIHRNRGENVEKGTEGLKDTAVASENTETVPPSETVPVESSEEKKEPSSEVLSEDAFSEELFYEDPRLSAIDRFENPGIISADVTFVNIRRSPSTDSDIIGKAMVHSGFDLLGIEGDWAHIESEGSEGYVSAHFVLSGDDAVEAAKEYCKINAFSYANRVKAYSDPDENSSVAFTMYAENGYEVTELQDEWVKLCTNENQTGFVKRDLLSIRYSVIAPFFFEEGEALSSLRRNIIDYAFEWYGGEYVWGGLALGEGVDCSGYVLRVFQHFNIELPRLSYEQAQWGTAVASLDEAKPGDLLFFRGFYDNGVLSEGVGHVGIYIGNQKMIHAASHERGIIVDTYNYLEEPLCIRRVIND